MVVERFDLGGKAALVLGSGVVGQAAALALAEAGANVAVVAATQEGEEVMAAKRTARRVESMGGRSLAQAIDASNGTAVQVMTRQVAKDLGGLDILVNCQDLYLAKAAERLADVDWQRVINLNLSSVFYACRAAAREMERRGGGKMINVASAIVEAGVDPGVAYWAAKGGLIALTRALSQELASRGIWVNCLAPGWLEGTAAVRPGAEAVSGARYVPQPRRGFPTDLAAAVVYLASTSSEHLRGQVIFVENAVPSP